MPPTDPPRTPSARARRLLFSYPPTHSIIAAMGLVALVMGFLVFRVFGRDVPADVFITLFGSKTSGTIVSRAADARMSVDHVHPTRFGFTYVVSGATLESRSFALVVPAQLAYTPRVDVEYLSFAPEDARIVGTTRNEGGDSIGWALAVMIAFGASSIGVPWWAMRRKRRAFERGAPARGVVTFVGESSVTINGRRPRKISWTFSDDQNRTFGGSLTAFSSSDLPPFSEGEQVTVLYDRDDPTANIVFVE